LITSPGRAPRQETRAAGFQLAENRPYLRRTAPRRFRK
jgi:hypothetical protein